MNPVSQRTDNTTQWTTVKGPKIIIYKTPHRQKVNIEQHEPRKNSDAPDGQAFPATLVALVVLLLNETNIICNRTLGHQYA